MRSFILRIANGDIGKLFIIGVLALISLVITFYVYYIKAGSQFLLVYQILPHLYLIPIILVSLWYPKRGLQVTILLALAVFINSSLLALAGYPIDPVLSLLYSGLDIGLFVSVVLYAKDRHLVEAMLKNLLARQREGLAAQAGDIPDTESLLARLKDPDEEVREESVRHLGELCDGRAVPYLIERLGDDSAYVRKAAAWSLGQIGDPGVFAPLLDALRDPDRNVRESAAESLGAIGRTNPKPLLPALQDPDWHIRMGAVIALRICGYNRDLSLFIPLLSDENRYVRRETIKTLGRIGDESIVDRLAPLLKDDDAGVRIRAVGALGKIGGPHAYTLLEEALSDPEWEVRVKARKELDNQDVNSDL